MHSQIKPNGKKIDITGDFTEIVLNGVSISIPDAAKYINSQQISKRIAGPGSDIYAGQCVILGQTFNVVAAPKDLKNVTDYYDTVKRVGQMNANGRTFETAEAIKEAVQDGSYKGEYFIPARQISQENLAPNSRAGDFKGTFDDSSIYPKWYWTSTENMYGVPDSKRSDHMFTVQFRDNHWDRSHVTDKYRHSCRPVRLVATSAPRQK